MRQAREATHGLGGLGRGTGGDHQRSGHDHGSAHERPGHDHGHDHAAGEAKLDVEKLDCFRVAIEFQALAAQLLPKGCGALRDQLDRASVSIALNLSEGAGCRSPRQKARYYAIPHHPAGQLELQVRSLPLRAASEMLLIVYRYGPKRIDETVEEALRVKIPKLLEAQADRRLLMLERDQVGVDPRAIVDEVERVRRAFPQTERVDEICIADTADFGGNDKGRYVCFSRASAAGDDEESFTFYDAVLITMSRRGKPIPV